jgi:aerobic carbon-monoxide dehydrogenase large subunit
MGLIGKPELRVEDDALLTGQGRYIADIKLPGMLHVVLVRSQRAHARLRRIDASAARALPDVAAVFTAEDLPEAARILPDTHPNPVLTHSRGPGTLAAEKVRYVGEPVAAVVAKNPYVAEDAAELVEIEYEPLLPVIDLERAIAPGAARVHDDMPSNVAARLPIRKGDVDAAFATAACIVKERLEIHRGAGQAMETRGIVAYWDDCERRLVLWSTTQVPFVLRAALAAALSLPEYVVRVMSPDVGGGFGYKGFPYSEDILIPAIAMKLRAPIKWIEDRREHLIASYQERSQLHDAEMAVDRSGAILGIRGRFLHDSGAYSPWGPVVPLLTLVNIPGPYKVPAYAMEGLMIYTNCVPVVPVRGVGRAQAVFVVEQLLDRAAERLGIDIAEIRRRNLVPGSEMPYNTGFTSRDGTARTYDSGDVPALLDRALAIISYEARRREQAELRAKGRYIGLGVACMVEETGIGPYEEASVAIEPDGTAIVRVGTPSQGQGQKTILAQIVGDVLALPVEKVRVLAGNTDLVRYSIGTYGSRVALVTGSAALLAAREARARTLRVAAEMLEATEEDLDLENGCVVVKGTDRRVPIAEAARRALGSAGHSLADGMSPGLGAIESFCVPTIAYPTGAHAAAVEVDVRTGEVRILQYAAVHDFGAIINPMIVDGQLIGGFAHGIGNAFLERVKYDADGQILTGSFADYLMPTALDVPRLDRDYIGHPTPLNPLGAKGAGQGGVIPVPAAIASAVLDALRPLGVRIRSVPFSQSDLLAQIEAAVRARVLAQ